MRQPKWLVFSSVGDQYNLSFWEQFDRPYDICVAYYGEQEFAYRDKVEYFQKSKDFKIPNFLRCVEVFPAMLDYDYYLFLDDDLILDADVIPAIFEAAAKFKLSLCQPSLTRSSDFVWQHTRHKPGLLMEYTNFVEVQCPCLSRDFLLKTLRFFEHVDTGSIMDVAWSGVLGDEKEKAAVFHNLQVYHPHSPRGRVRILEAKKNYLEDRNIITAKIAELLGLPEGEAERLIDYEPRVYRKVYKNRPVYIFWKLRHSMTSNFITERYKKSIKWVRLVLSEKNRQKWRINAAALKKKSHKKFNIDWDRQSAERFKQQTNFEEKYTDLFRYFMTGAFIYRSRDKSRVFYPGSPGRKNMLQDGLEGFARIAPAAAVWLAGGRSSKVRLLSGYELDLKDFLRQTIDSGTAKESAGYWGNMWDCSQKIVEAHDIAISFWLLKKRVKEFFTAETTEQVAQWLAQVNQYRTYDSNWHLFPCVVNAVLLDLNLGGSEEALKQHFNRLKDFYLNNGWFCDGPNSPADYYNAWGFQYSLFWLRQIRPDFEQEFIDDVRRKFINSYRLLITPRGFPMIGRSMIYRTAASAPFLICAHHHEIPYGEAKRAFDATWSFFISEGALSGGSMSLGLFRENLAWVEPYSGPASPLWGLRSLTLALLFPPDHEFWSCAPQKLAVEKNDFEERIPGLDWRIKGDKVSGVVTVEKPNGLNPDKLKFEKYGLSMKLESFLFRGRRRYLNYDFKYRLKRYTSSPETQKEIYREKRR